MVAASVSIFLISLVVNEIVFPRLDFITGVNWIYLPAGMRLLCTLLFGEAGAAGILIASWLACFCYFFPNDLLRSFAGGIISALAPYLSYRFMSERYHLSSSLRELTGNRLLKGVVLYAIASSSMHHLWFFLVRDIHASLASWGVMFIGDLTGSLIVLYIVKVVIGLFKTVRIGPK
ncbi:hypothetical protein hmeg3_09680 [Herbaspirillum sp. meg3]|nr:hypothetical protein hmeg3_09680 [Herbaspirillum sp. meg3]